MGGASARDRELSQLRIGREGKERVKEQDCWLARREQTKSGR